MSSPLQTTILDRVRAVLSRVTGFPLSDITAETSLESLGADELDLIDIAIELEDQFGCQLDENEMHQAGTAGELCALVESKREAANV